MKILVLGASGYTGRYIKRELEKQNNSVLGTYRTPLAEYERDCSMMNYELSNESKLKVILEYTNPDIVISCLNGDYQKQLKAYEIITDYLARYSNKKFIFLSTSNVFDGTLETVHYENDKPMAVSEYGKFKIQCENMIKDVLGDNGIIIRIPEIWGIGSPRLEEIKTKIREGKPITVVKNLFVNYTTNKQIAMWISYIIENDLKGIFHVGTKDLSESMQFHKELISTLQLGKPIYNVIKEFPIKQVQAVLPNRSDIPVSMQFGVNDVIEYMNTV